MSNVQKIFYDLPTVADVLSGAFYHCFYCSFRCVFFRPTLKPILGAKLSENRRDPSRHRVAPCDVTMRYIDCDPRILRKMFEDVIYEASPGR